MSSSRPEKLPADIEALLALERRVPPPSPVARAQLAARLGLGALSGPPGQIPATRWWATAGARVAALVLVGAVATTVWLAARRESSPPPIAPPKVLAAPAPVPAPAPAPARPAAVAPDDTVEGRAAAPETEIGLLRRARRALGRGDVRTALAALERHQRRWPEGELAQEREVLAIQALTLAGARAQARARADRYLERFPTSTLTGTVRELRRRLDGD